MMNRLQIAAQLRATLQKFAATLPDDQKIEVACVFPAYQAGKAYAAGDVFRYGSNNVGDPQLYQVLQDHVSADHWQPDAAESLYKAIGITAEGYAEWAQPVGASDAYNIGDIVSFNGVLYKSLIDANVWSPADYPAGWAEYTEAEQ